MAVVKRLLENGANPNLLDDLLRSSPLHLASSSLNAEFIRILLTFGADIEKGRFRDRGYETPRRFTSPAEEVALTPWRCSFGIITPQNWTFLRGSWRESWPEESDSHVKIIEFLLHNVAKLHTAGICVCDENVENLDDGMLDFLIGRDIRPECAEKIARMKLDAVYRRVVDDIYLYDVLVLSVNELVAQFRKYPLLWESLCSFDLEGKYPLYADILSAKIKNAKWKNDMLHNCVSFILGIFPGMPILCAELVSTYLSDTDKRMLFCACRPEDFYDY